MVFNHFLKLPIFKRRSMYFHKLCIRYHYLQQNPHTQSQECILILFSIFFIPRMLHIKSVILRIISLLNQLMSEWNQPGFNSFLQIANKIVRKYWVINLIIHSLLLHRMKAVPPFPDYLMCDVPSRRSLYNSIHRVNFWNIF